LEEEVLGRKYFEEEIEIYQEEIRVVEEEEEDRLGRE
jgi:hypothetical protein